MSELLPLEQAPAGLGAALRKAGFESFTSIQQAILDPELAGRDLRISSQTGSGKTVALGLLLAPSVAIAAAMAKPKKARRSAPAAPVALLIAPTRELAGQLGRELRWLYEPLAARVLVVTGGTSVMQERSQLSTLPQVVIGTPGRLLDHLKAGALELDRLQTVALDEADEMLDMNFEEELDGILDFAPDVRRTHLVSATFPREVVRLADRLQQDAVSVQGTALGKANADIEHLVMHVRQADRFNAATNVLLRYPEDKTLLFVRTRTETVRLADELCAAGLAARALNGEMTQRERTATFTQFRNGTIRYLVATDVAARGLDVHDIGRVIQVDLPDNADVFTHRSGRTGRAGRRGTNVLFAAARAERRVQSMLRAARVDARLVPIPTPEEIFAAADERTGDSFLRDLANQTVEPDSRATALAERLLAEHSPTELVACLLKREAKRVQGTPKRVRDDAKPARHERSPRKVGPNGQSRRRPQGDFVTYQVSWGGQAGADTRKLLAMVCRRGGVSSEVVGAIRVLPKSSTVEIAASAAQSFERAVARPDKRNPRARFRRWDPRAKVKADTTGKPGAKAKRERRRPSSARYA
ncbi:MAG: DEAD/DEAH box helicase [Myxococcales bacterium]|nr:DEAD/DEAH box helicase [Myxococcales bacterium]